MENCVLSAKRRTPRKVEDQSGSPQRRRTAAHRTQPLHGADCRHAVGAQLSAQQKEIQHPNMLRLLES